MQIRPRGIFRYAFALLPVAAASSTSLLLQGPLPDGFLIFFLLAVMLAGWFGGTGPGLFAVFLSMLAVSYYFMPPYRAFAVELDELPYFLTFLISAILASWLASAKRAAEDRQRAHLDELFEQTPEAILLVDLQSRVLRVNKEFTRIFGWSKELASGRPSIELIVPTQLREESVANLRRLTEGRIVSVETVRQRRDGSLLHVSEVSFPVVSDGACLAYYSIFRDITDEKRASEKLQKAQAELAHLSRITTMGELAASIAHEVNQPIAAIVTNSNAAVRWLSQQPPLLEDVQESLGGIVRDANRAAQVIQRIRSILRKSPTAMVPVDLNDVVREVLAVTNSEIKSRAVVTTTELQAGAPPVAGDRVQLQQVLLNLIMNGLDAMNTVSQRPRQMTIRSLYSSDAVTIQVQDCGQGVDREHMAKIFDPFFTTKKDGVGMGLTIGRSIIEAHGGRLWAELGNPHGTILSFTIPTLGKRE